MRKQKIDEFATHRVLRNIKVHTTYYEPGDHAALADEHAEELEGHVEPLSDEEQAQDAVVKPTPQEKAAATRAAKKAAADAAKASEGAGDGKKEGE